MIIDMWSGMMSRTTDDCKQMLGDLMQKVEEQGKEIQQMRREGRGRSSYKQDYSYQIRGRSPFQNKNTYNFWQNRRNQRQSFNYNINKRSIEDLIDSPRSQVQEELSSNNYRGQIQTSQRNTFQGGQFSTNSSNMAASVLERWRMVCYECLHLLPKVSYLPPNSQTCMMCNGRGVSFQYHDYKIHNKYIPCHLCSKSWDGLNELFVCQRCSGTGIFHRLNNTMPVQQSIIVQQQQSVQSVLTLPGQPLISSSFCWGSGWGSNGW